MTVAEARTFLSDQLAIPESDTVHLVKTASERARSYDSYAADREVQAAERRAHAARLREAASVLLEHAQSELKKGVGPA